ncbi:MAG: glycosyltransferase family 2 protein, partial [Hellea sp.]|nr:glycosyltransferase family 2 protein [Hellea sp.]
MITVIIPNLNNAGGLARLLSQLSGGVERIIVSDGFSDDESLKAAAGFGVNLAIGTASRGAQLRRGVRLALDAEWLLFLHADSRLPENWRALIDDHIQNNPDKAGHFKLRLDSSRLGARIIEACAQLRSRAWALPYGDQGLLISRALYEAVGGYPDLPLFEDVKIIEAITAGRGRRRLRRIKGAITSSAAKYERDGFMRRGWRNFGLIRRYRQGAPVED